MNHYVFIVLAFVLAIAGLTLGNTSPDLSETIQDIEEARNIHVKWLNRLIEEPDPALERIVGDVDHQRKWIRIYDQTLYYLRREVSNL